MPTHVSSASELHAALKSADGGETILLKSGDYGWMKLENLKFDKPVTIKSADGDGGARFQHVTINNASHLTLDDVTVTFGRAEQSNDKAIDIRNADHIKITNSEIVGNPQTKNWADVGRGVEVWQNSHDIELSGNHFHHLSRAGIFFGNHITLKNNLVDDIRLDGFFFGKSKDLLIENNFMTNFYRQGSDHADYIQFDPGTTGPARDVIIRGNVMLKGDGNGDVQGIFGANHHMDVHKGVFENFLIEDNIYFDHGLNAIQFYSGKDMTVRNNTVLTDPGDGRVVWIRLHGPQTDSVLEDNVSTQVNAEGGARASGSIIAQYRDPAGANYYGDLFADPFADPAMLADLAPRAGSPIAFGSGKGAEARFKELLNDGAPDEDRPKEIAEDDAAKDEGDTDAPARDDSDGNEGDADTVDTVKDKNDSDDGLKDKSPASASLDPVLNAEPGLFTGEGSELVLPHQSAFELTDGTLEMTFTPETVAGRQALFSKDSWGYDDGGHFTILLYNGNLNARLQSDSESFLVRAPDSITAGEEHHLAVRFGDDGLKLYLDGALVDSNDYTGGLSGNTEPIVIGAGQRRSGDGVAEPLEDFFTGTIADVALYEGAAGSDEGAEDSLLLS